MKKLFLPLALFLAISCKKNNSIDDQPASSPDAKNLSQSSVRALNTTNAINVQSMGAKGDGVTDDTQAIINSLAKAVASNVPNIYFPDGTYLVSQAGNASGVIALANGVGMEGNSPSTCHIKLSGGRYNPPALFYQAWWSSPSISNIVIQGIDFDGQLSAQTYASTYQYGHALSINNGQNIVIESCKFENFRGDGLLFGDTFESSLNLRITYNVSVHDNEFFNIYREGTMFCCTNGGSFYNNNVHGNGYLVGGVDIERHSVNETVMNISVYNNLFNFDDGYGPVERGGPSARYRRAVTMGFFYSGYTNATADGRSGSHKIYNNTIYQGQIDCWGHTNVIISKNIFLNTYENITGVNMVSGPTVNIADPAITTGLGGIAVNNNNINSGMPGNGIAFNHYTNVSANANTITNTQLDGITMYNASGVVDSNMVSNVGLVTQRASGIVINGNTSGLLVGFNTVSDTRTGNNRTVNYAVAMQSTNAGAVPPNIFYNKGINLFAGLISQYYYQLNYATITGNTSQ
jgi:Pectate lyase superfamily protein